jgi:integral membrane sensor domain MASE1
VSALRIVLAVIGGCCYLGVMTSMLRALVVPGVGSTMFAGWLGRAVGTVVGWLCLLAADHRLRRNRILLAEAPVLLSALLVSWLLGFLGALALLILPVSASFGAALR